MIHIEDLGGGKRWLVVRPGKSGSALLLAVSTNQRQRARISDQTGGRVGFFLSTGNFAKDHLRFIQAWVVFLEASRQEAYGTVAVFVDPFGTKWDLLQPAETEFP